MVCLVNIYCIVGRDDIADVYQYLPYEQRFSETVAAIKKASSIEALKQEAVGSRYLRRVNTKGKAMG